MIPFPILEEKPPVPKPVEGKVLPFVKPEAKPNPPFDTNRDPGDEDDEKGEP